MLEHDILEVAFIQDLALPEMLSYIPCVLDMIDDPFDWAFQQGGGWVSMVSRTDRQTKGEWEWIGRQRQVDGKCIAVSDKLRPIYTILQ